MRRRDHSSREARDISPARAAALEIRGTLRGLRQLLRDDAGRYCTMGGDPLAALLPHGLAMP